MHLYSKDIRVQTFLKWYQAVFPYSVCHWRDNINKSYTFMYTWLKKRCPWTMRFQGFMGIRSLAKQIQSSFDKSLHCHEMLVQMQIPRVLCWRHTGVFFLSSKKAFRSYLMIFKCALAIWLHSLTVEISYMSSTGEVVNFATKTRNHLTFFKMHRCEKLQ